MSAGNTASDTAALAKALRTLAYAAASIAYPDPREPCDMAALRRATRRAFDLLAQIDARARSQESSS